MKKCILLILICLVNASFLNSQVVSSGKATIRINNRAKMKSSLKAGLIPGEDGARHCAPVVMGKYYALIIGIDNYDRSQDTVA